MTVPVDFRAILDTAAMPVVVYDREMRFVFANQAFCRSVLKKWEDLEGQQVGNMFPESPERMDAMRSRFACAFAGKTSTAEVRPYHILGPDGERIERHWRSVITPFFGPDGNVVYAVQSGEDVTEEVALRAQKDLIAQELEHRVRNTLAMVGSLAFLTGQHTPSVDAFVETFTDRLEAMSRNLFMISDNHWRGLPLRTIIESELAQVVSADDPRVLLSGPELILSVRSTKWAALLAHELVINATRYGCFAVTGGKLEVSWRIVDGTFIIDWVEIGRKGTGTPERRGFGTQMLELMPNVTAEREFRDEGMSLRITVAGSFHVPQSAPATGG